MAEKADTGLRARDRNALIAFALGLVLLLGGLFVGAYDDAGTGLGGVFMIAGAVLVVLGLVFYRRR